MLSGSASISCILNGPVDEWDLACIFSVFGSIAEAIGYSEFPARHTDIQQMLKRVIGAVKDSSNENCPHIILPVLATLLSLLLLASRSVISPLDLQMVGLEDCFFINMIKIKVLRSNPYVLGLIFLLWLHTESAHRQSPKQRHTSNQSSTTSSSAPSPSSDNIEGNICDDGIISIVDLLSLAIDCIADAHRTGSYPTPDDDYFIWLAFYAFHRYSSRLSKAIASYVHTQDSSDHHELECYTTCTTKNVSHSSVGFRASLISSNLVPDKSLLLMASMCTNASSDLLNEENTILPTSQSGMAQDNFNLPSTNDASYIMFLIEAYFLLFPDRSNCIADILCYVPYLPQSFISPIMGLLAPPILTELSFNVRISTRNRCILGLIFVNAVLAQTVIAYQYAITARYLLRQMKFSWIRAYIPLSVISPNVYFFGARSRVFHITILDDDEYINEVRLLLNNKSRVNESPEDGSRRVNIRRSKK